MEQVEMGPVQRLVQFVYGQKQHSLGYKQGWSQWSTFFLNEFVNIYKYTHIYKRSYIVLTHSKIVDHGTRIEKEDTEYEDITA